MGWIMIKPASQNKPVFSRVYFKKLAVLLGAMLAGIVLTGVIHELSHLSAAAILGIPVLKFSFFDWQYLSPTITFGARNPAAMLLTLYAGGLVTGTIWLIVYTVCFIHKKYAEKSLMWWCTGLLLAMLAYWQLVQGVLEGLLHQVYISGAGNPASISFLIQSLSFILGLAIYLKQTDYWHNHTGNKYTHH